MLVFHRTVLIFFATMALSACTSELPSAEANSDEFAVKSITLALNGDFEKLYSITETDWNKEQWVGSMQFGVGQMVSEVKKCGGIEQIVVTESKTSADNTRARVKVRVTLKNRDQKGCASFNPGEIVLVKTAAGWRNKG